MTAAITPHQIRCDNDLSMYQSLLENNDVKKVNEFIAKREEEGPIGTRRRLLGTSVRLSRRMAPEVHRMADECIELLEMKIPHELYVYSSPQFNAACFKPENDQLFVMFSSSLLEAFEGSELRFVIGHEFGHHVYRHHDIPIGYLLNGQARPDPKLALDLFTWSRYAEISADRAGAHCAQDLNGVAKALFKLASGLTSKVVEFSFNDFLQQVDEMQVEDTAPGNNAPQEDWFSTHPFSPLRVKALKYFHESELAVPGGMNKHDLEVAVQGVMSLMEPSYIEGRTDTAEAMRRLLFAGAVVVADAADGISEKEIEVFEQFFGRDAFSDRLSVERIERELPGRVSAVKDNASMTQRMQVLRDLCVVAKAEGPMVNAERAVLDQIADGLEVPRSFICQFTESNYDPINNN
ncbi:MAG: M48 family metallopeptidase [Pseudomonadota bacterium]